MKTKLIFGGLMAFSTFANAQWAINGNPAVVPANFMGSINAADVRFAAANVERMRIRNGNGFIGINTITPGNRLHVNATSATDDGIRIAQAGAGRCSLFLENTNGSGTTWGLYSDNASNFSILDNTSTATHLFISGGVGNVGINTSNATSRLTIDASNTTDDGILINQSNTGNSSLFLNNTNGSGRNWALQSDNGGSFHITDYTGSTDRMIVNNAGDVSIGLIAGGARLHVYTGNSTGIIGEGPDNGIIGSANGSTGNAIITGVTGRGQSGSLSNYGGHFFTTDVGNGASNYGIYAEVNNPTGGSTNYAVYGDVSGNSSGGGGPVYAGYFNGDVVTTSTGYYFSDRNFKKDIRTIESSMDVISRLNPVTYNFDREAHPGINLPSVKQYGFISQEIKQILPEFTKEIVHPAKYDKDGKELSPKQEVLGLNYQGFIALLTKGVQEQQKMIEGLNATVAMQQQQMDEQQVLINELMGKGATGLQPGGSLGGFSMEQNEPNPYNGQTVVKYNLPASVTAASLVICDLTGKQVLSVPLTQKGAASVTISSEKLSAGIYIYSIIADNKIMASKRMAVSEK